MYNKDVLEMIRGCSELLQEKIKEQLVASKLDKMELDDCTFPSYDMDGDAVDIWIKNVFMKDDDVWVEFQDYTLESRKCPLACFDVSQLYSIYSAM